VNAQGANAARVKWLEVRVSELQKEVRDLKERLAYAEGVEFESMVG